MRKIVIFVAFSVFFILNTLSAQAQLKYEWVPVQMDEKWDTGKDHTANKIISKYEPLVAPLMEIIGYSDAEYTKDRPESGLSNFTADIIRESAAQAMNCRVDLAMMNFGGIRTSLPKGAVRVYDIMSIFPFNNYIVLLDVKGSDLKEIFTSMVQRRRYEAYSNVTIIADNNHLQKLLVGGKPIDDNKIYKLATLDFIYQGGDSFSLKQLTYNLVETHILLRDAVAEHIRKKTANKQTINLKEDGRLKIKDWK